MGSQPSSVQVEPSGVRRTTGMRRHVPTIPTPLQQAAARVSQLDNLSIYATMPP